MPGCVPPSGLQFVEFAKVVCDQLIAKGHWADYIDPCRRGGDTATHAAAIHACMRRRHHACMAASAP